MSSTVIQRFRRALPVALAAVALTLAQHAPARADTAPQQQVCGTVDLASANGPDAARAFDCFHDAFAGCKPATLLASGQDAGLATSWTFTTVDGGDDHGCSISEVVEKASGGTKTTDAYLCRTVSREKDGLHFTGCGVQKEVSLRVGAATPIAQQAVTPKN